MYYKFKNYIPLLLSVLLIGELFSFYPQLAGVNYSGVITVVVGFLGYFVYLKQKNDYKRDAASIIVNEIRTAESIMRGIKSTSPMRIDDFRKLLPVSSWEKYGHLFVSDLDRDEFELISTFYNRCCSFDEAAKLENPTTQIQHKGQMQQRALVDLALRASELGLNYDDIKTKFLKFSGDETYTFSSLALTTAMVNTINSFEFILTSVACNKLKKIASTFFVKI